MCMHLAHSHTVLCHCACMCSLNPSALWCRQDTHQHMHLVRQPGNDFDNHSCCWSMKMQCVGMKGYRHTSLHNHGAARSRHLTLIDSCCCCAGAMLYFGIKYHSHTCIQDHNAAGSDYLALTGVAVVVQGRCSTLESRTQTRRHMPFMMQAPTASTCWPMHLLKTSPPLLPSLR